MTSKEELCRKITEIYPDIGVCGIDIDVEYSNDKGVWAVDLKKDEHELKTYLEEVDARTCLEGKKCVSLGLQIAELVNNIKQI